MIEDFFPSAHNDDIIQLGQIDGINLIKINFEQQAKREAEYIKSLIKGEN